MYMQKKKKKRTQEININPFLQHQNFLPKKSKETFEKKKRKKEPSKEEEERTENSHKEVRERERAHPIVWPPALSSGLPGAC